MDDQKNDKKKFKAYRPSFEPENLKTNGKQK
jgi:hypothetical protein